MSSQSVDKEKKAEGDTTLKLFAQYNNHVSEKNSNIDEIDKDANSESPDDPQDKLVKENVKLSIRVQEQETEIIDLQRAMAALEKKLEYLNEHPVEPPKATPVPPVRSSHRSISSKSHSRSNTEDNILPNFKKDLPEDLNAAPDLASDLSGLIATDSSSPQHSNRYTSVINNTIHSPLSISNADEGLDSIDEPAFNKISSAPNLHNSDPQSRQLAAPSRNDIDNANSSSPINKNTFISPRSELLGSPIKMRQQTTSRSGMHHDLLKDVDEKTLKSMDMTSSHSVHTSSPSMATSKTAVNSIPQPSPFKMRGRAHSSANSKNTLSMTNSKPEEAIPFFDQDNLHSIVVDVVSTLYINPNSKSNESLILSSVIDKKTGREMFQSAKPLAKLNQLHDFIKSNIDSKDVPNIPHKHIFMSPMPNKMDSRRKEVNNFFTFILSLPNTSPKVNEEIAKYLTTNIVHQQKISKSSKKEGSLVVKRSKAIGSNWKIRYGVLSSEGTLDLYDKDQIIEILQMHNCSIELIPNTPEDKHGSKNGILLTEYKKGNLSNVSKYFLCFETSKEREAWVTCLSQYVENTPMRQSSTGSKEIPSKGQALSENHARSSPRLDQMQQLDTSNDTRDIHNMNKDNKDNKDNKKNKTKGLFLFKKLGQNGSDSENVGDDEKDTLRSQQSFSNVSQLTTDTSSNGIFGAPLANCLEVSSNLYQGKYRIPSIVYRCLEYLYKNRAIGERGIFRLSGSSSLMKSLQEQFEKRHDIDLFNYNQHLEEANIDQPFIDINTVSGLLKLYFRQLPHLLIEDNNYGTFLTITNQLANNPSQIALEFRTIINSGVVSQNNISLMYALFELLLRIYQNKDINKMSIKNICIVFSPTLKLPAAILQPFIADFECIFNNSEPVDNSIREVIDIEIPFA